MKSAIRLSFKWIEYKPFFECHWRASLVPAAAVIPAPIVYLNVVAVKKLVVEFLALPQPLLSAIRGCHPLGNVLCGKPRPREQAFYFEEIRVFQAGLCLNISAWNNGIGFVLLLVIGHLMINRDSWGHSYSFVRGEIHGLDEDELMRKHLPRMFSLIKNES